MTKTTVLFIDDDEILLELLTDNASAEGYQPISAKNGLDGLLLARQSAPDLVVLDVMMPGMDGWETCRRLRNESAVPIIMLTAKGEVTDKLRGFGLGVDDYVTKPFSFAELSARINAVLARTGGKKVKAQKFQSDDLIVEFDQRRVSSAGVEVNLTPTEYRLLETLVQHAGRPISTEYLLLEVWGAEYSGEPEHVKHYIWTLRKKIEIDPRNPRHILTERGFGYRLE